MNGRGEPSYVLVSRCVDLMVAECVSSAHYRPTTNAARASLQAVRAACYFTLAGKRPAILASGHRVLSGLPVCSSAAPGLVHRAEGGGRRAAGRRHTPAHTSAYGHTRVCTHAVIVLSGCAAFSFSFRDRRWSRRATPAYPAYFASTIDADTACRR